MESISTTLLCFAVTLLLSSGWVRTSAYGHDYRDALAKSILFYEGQRSGKLPPSQRATWRADSGLKDGHSEGVNLVGGYYDAGDNVKFGLPMAFTITMLSWSVVEYGSQMASSGELSYALEAIKWGTDYLLNAHPEPNVLWGEVGDGVSDHECWQRPEDMTTPRQAYKIDANNPGSDLAGETAAAMAAASLALRNSNKGYASVLVQHAKQLFSFADTHRGKYDSSISIARSFYQSKSGYADELLWASMWLYEATGENYYLDYAMENAASLGGTSWAMTEFSWDVKYAGLQVLASKVLLRGDKGSDRNVLMKYQSKAEFFLCACLQKNQGKNVQRTPGGLLYVRPWNNMQYVTGAAFLMTVYSDYLSASKQSLKCSAGSVASSELLTAARSQIDYILGNNPRATSYLVGYGSNYPQHVHHRGSSIVSYHVDSEFVSCKAGYANWFGRSGADPNVLVGAIVGGPDQNDNYADARNNYEQSEPATYNNAPLIGVLARLHAGGDYYSAQFYIKPSAMQVTSQSLPSLRQSSSLPGTNRPQKRQNGSSNSAIISIAQNMTSSWTFRGQALYRYEASLTNNSPLQRLEQVVLTVDGLKGPLWGLTKVGPNSFTFPAWAKSLPPKQKLSFVYIHAVSEPASVTISTSTFA